jgi:hypothetical protein
MFVFDYSKEQTKVLFQNAIFSINYAN